MNSGLSGAKCERTEENFKESRVHGEVEQYVRAVFRPAMKLQFHRIQFNCFLKKFDFKCRAMRFIDSNITYYFRT